MKCYFKRSSSSTLVQFSNSSEDNNNDDVGDGGGISVFTLLTIPCFGAYEVFKILLITAYTFEFVLNKIYLLCMYVCMYSHLYILND